MYLLRLTKSISNYTHERMLVQEAEAPHTVLPEVITEPGRGPTNRDNFILFSLPAKPLETHWSK
jgi:hypothetical protein